MDYKLSDNVIANIIQLLQLSMVTGTDISDQFRMITLTPSELSEGKLELSAGYAESHENVILKLVEEAQALSAQLEKSESEEKDVVGFVNS